MTICLTHRINTNLVIQCKTSILLKLFNFQVKVIIFKNSMNLYLVPSLIVVFHVLNKF